jgi:thiol-disulfide isomerase/thioredoxin
MTPKTDYTIILYTAAYCPYCKDFKPVWEEFSKKAKKEIKDKEKSIKI